MTSALLAPAFLRLAPPPPSAAEIWLGELPLTVLVGVTGVGKSTALRALPGRRVLPDRRVITDAVMLAPLRGGPVTDREERFRLTAEYRAGHPGGMAQAAAGLVAVRSHWAAPGEPGAIFDGLRGLDEVSYAAQHCPAWRFLALGAPDLTRVRRLLGRADAFDRVEGAAVPAGGDLEAELRRVPGASEVFTDADLREMGGWPAQGLDPAEVLAKVRIVVSERRSYDPAAAEAFLRTLPPGRALVLDTGTLTPDEVARRVQAWA